MQRTETLEVRNVSRPALHACSPVHVATAVSCDKWRALPCTPAAHTFQMNVVLACISRGPREHARGAPFQVLASLQLQNSTSARCTAQHNSSHAQYDLYAVSYLGKHLRKRQRGHESRSRNHGFAVAQR